MTRSEKGDRMERELVSETYSRGFGVTRIPASGSATDRELPDVYVGSYGVHYGIEAKSSSGSPIYVDMEEVIDLVVFCNMIGARPRIGARFNREDWSFFHPSDLHTTPECNFRIKKEKAVNEGESLEEL